MEVGRRRPAPQSPPPPAGRCPPELRPPPRSVSPPPCPGTCCAPGWARCRRARCCWARCWVSAGGAWEPRTGSGWGGGEGRRGALRAGGSGRGAGGAALAALLMSRCRPSGALGGDARGPRGSRGTAPRTAPWGRTPQSGRAVLCSHRGHFPADNSTSRSASSGKKSMYFFPVIKPAAPPCVRRCPRAAPPCPAPSVGFFPSFSLFLRVEGEV